VDLAELAVQVEQVSRQYGDRSSTAGRAAFDIRSVRGQGVLAFGHGGNR
jgi:hypothetical protein